MLEKRHKTAAVAAIAVFFALALFQSTLVSAELNPWEHVSGEYQIIGKAISIKPSGVNEASYRNESQLNFGVTTAGQPVVIIPEGEQMPQEFASEKNIVRYSQNALNAKGKFLVVVAGYSAYSWARSATFGYGSGEISATGIMSISTFEFHYQGNSDSASFSTVKSANESRVKISGAEDGDIAVLEKYFQVFDSTTFQTEDAKITAKASKKAGVTSISLNNPQALDLFAKVQRDASKFVITGTSLILEAGNQEAYLGISDDLGIVFEPQQGNISVLVSPERTRCCIEKATAEHAIFEAIMAERLETTERGLKAGDRVIAWAVDSKGSISTAFAGVIKSVDFFNNEITITTDQGEEKTVSGDTFLTLWGWQTKQKLGERLTALQAKARDAIAQLERMEKQKIDEAMAAFGTGKFEQEKDKLKIAARTSLDILQINNAFFKYTSGAVKKIDPVVGEMNEKITELIRAGKWPPAADSEDYKLLERLEQEGSQLLKDAIRRRDADIGEISLQIEKGRPFIHYFTGFRNGEEIIIGWSPVGITEFNENSKAYLIKSELLPSEGEALRAAGAQKHKDIIFELGNRPLLLEEPYSIKYKNKASQLDFIKVVMPQDVRDKLFPKKPLGSISIISEKVSSKPEFAMVRKAPLQAIRYGPWYKAFLEKYSPVTFPFLKETVQEGVLSIAGIHETVNSDLALGFYQKAADIDPNSNAGKAALTKIDILKSLKALSMAQQTLNLYEIQIMQRIRPRSILYAQDIMDRTMGFDQISIGSPEFQRRELAALFAMIDSISPLNIVFDIQRPSVVIATNDMRAKWGPKEEEQWYKERFRMDREAMVVAEELIREGQVKNLNEAVELIKVVAAPSNYQSEIKSKFFLERTGANEFNAADLADGKESKWIKTKTMIYNETNQHFFTKGKPIEFMQFRKKGGAIEVRFANKDYYTQAAGEHKSDWWNLEKWNKFAYQTNQQIVEKAQQLMLSGVFLPADVNGLVIKFGESIEENILRANVPADSGDSLIKRVLSLKAEHYWFLANEPSIQAGIKMLDKKINDPGAEGELLQSAQEYRDKGNYQAAAMLARLVSQTSQNAETSARAFNMYVDILDPYGSFWNYQDETLDPSSVFDFVAEETNPVYWWGATKVFKGLSLAIKANRVLRLIPIGLRKVVSVPVRLITGKSAPAVTKNLGLIRSALGEELGKEIVPVTRYVALTEDIQIISGGRTAHTVSRVGLYSLERDLTAENLQALRALGQVTRQGDLTLIKFRSGGYGAIVKGIESNPNVIGQALSELTGGRSAMFELSAVTEKLGEKARWAAAKGRMEMKPNEKAPQTSMKPENSKVPDYLDPEGEVGLPSAANQAVAELELPDTIVEKGRAAFESFISQLKKDPELADFFSPYYEEIIGTKMALYRIADTHPEKLADALEQVLRKNGISNFNRVGNRIEFTPDVSNYFGRLAQRAKLFSPDTKVVFDPARKLFDGTWLVEEEKIHVGIYGVFNFGVPGGKLLGKDTLLPHEWRHLQTSLFIERGKNYPFAMVFKMPERPRIKPYLTKGYGEYYQLDELLAYQDSLSRTIMPARAETLLQLAPGELGAYRKALTDIMLTTEGSAAVNLKSIAESAKLTMKSWQTTMDAIESDLANCTISADAGKITISQIGGKSIQLEAIEGEGSVGITLASPGGKEARILIQDAAFNNSVGQAAANPQFANVANIIQKAKARVNSQFSTINAVAELDSVEATKISSLAEQAVQAIDEMSTNPGDAAAKVSERTLALRQEVAKMRLETKKILVQAGCR